MLTQFTRKIVHATGLLALTFLSACYVTDVEIISKGEFAPVLGKFNCKNTISGEIDTHTFSETKTGILFSKSYEYTDSYSPAEKLKLRKISEKLFLAQNRISESKVAKNGYRFEYTFLYFIGTDQIVVMVANFMEQEPILEGKAGVMHVRFESIKLEMATFAKLHGKPSDVLSFLIGHEVGNLTAVSNCKRSS